jgi:AbiV family abortive infection protein
MLKDKNGNWVEYLEITEELWKKCIQETLQRVKKLLESAETLLDNGGSATICAGLYTYAVEEYGKILLLRKCKPFSEKVKIGFKNGFLCHTKKFSLAINDLPIDCITLKRGYFDPKIFDPKIFDTKAVIANLKARLGVFYCDFTDPGNEIKPVPQVNKKLLKKAIRKLHTIAPS